MTTRSSRISPRHRIRPCGLAVAGISVVLLGGLVEAQTRPTGGFSPVGPQTQAAVPSVPWLTDRQGPWLIKTETFVGENAAEQATELAAELRTLLSRPTYLHQIEIKADGKVEGKGLDRFGRPKMMRYQNPVSAVEIVVLVGDFTSIEDPRLVSTLDQIKRLRPKCMTTWDDDEAAIPFRDLRAQIDQTTRPAKEGTGPLRRAFATRNPMLPAEFFGAGGLDPFLLSINEPVEFSLLRCPGKYSLRVATFRGSAAISIEKGFDKYSRSQVTSKLEEAAVKAHLMTKELRSRGFDAYEYHDRTQSIVCIGSYNDVGRTLPDGSIEPNPTILAQVKKFGARSEMTKIGIPEVVPMHIELADKTKLEFDLQPLPIEVPRASVAQRLGASR